MKKIFQQQKLSFLIVSLGLMAACVEKSATTNNRVDREVTSVELFMTEPVRIVFKRSCQSCHGIDARGIAGIAPDLRRIKPRVSDEWAKYLRNSRDSHPVSQMPPVWLDRDEIRLIAEYLADSSKDNR